MTFRIEPFGAAYSNALLQAGEVPNMAEAYAAGEKQRVARDRLLAQRQASEMMQAGDQQGATNLLLSVADPGEGLRYQIAQQNAAAEQARTAFTDQQHAREYADTQREQAATAARAEQSLQLQREAAERAARKDAPMTPEEALQFGVTLPGAPGPRDPYYAPPAPQAPSAPPAAQPWQGPPQASQPELSDIPPVEGATVPPAGAPPQPGPIAQAVAPPPPPGMQDDRQARVQDVIRKGGSREDVMKILTETPRATPPAVFQMEDKLRDDWRSETLPFQKRVEGYRDFNQSYNQAIKMDKTSGPAAVGVVYSFLKNMDPAGAVLGSDVDMAMKSAGWWEQANNYVNSLEGNFLPKNVMEGMKQQVDARFGAAFQSYQQREKMMRDQAAGQGLDPYRAIEDQTGGVRPPKGWGEFTDTGERPAAGYQPGQGGAGIWDEFTKRLKQRLNRGAGPPQ